MNRIAEVPAVTISVPIPLALVHAVTGVVRYLDDMTTEDALADPVRFLCRVREEFAILHAKYIFSSDYQPQIQAADVEDF